MDFSKFKVPDWLIVGGALGFLIFGTFVDWFSLEGFGGGNAFDFFFTGTIPWLLIIAAGVVTVLLVGGVMKRGTIPWPLIIFAATALGFLLVLLRLIFGYSADSPFGDVDFDRAAGLYLSVLSAAVATVGAFLNFQAAGGDIKDFTDVSKLRSQFAGSGSSSAPPPPPPPAGGSTPPPPPPPTA